MLMSAQNASPAPLVLVLRNMTVDFLTQSLAVG